MWRFSSQGNWGQRPAVAAAVVSGLAGLIVTWLVAAIAGPDVYADFAVFWALLFFMVSVLFGVQQEMARGVAAVERAATEATASPWRRILVVAGVVARRSSWPCSRCSRRRRSVRPGSSGPSRSWSRVPCYVLVAAIQGALAGSDRWIDLALLLTVDAVLRLAFTGVALWIGGGAAALGWATALPIPLTVALGILRGGDASARSASTRFGHRDFHWNTARAVFAGVGAAFFVAGFPAVLAVFAGPRRPRSSRRSCS